MDSGNTLLSFCRSFVRLHHEDGKLRLDFDRFEMAHKSVINKQFRICFLEATLCYLLQAKDSKTLATQRLLF